MSDQNISICAPDDFSIKINKWKVREGFQVSNGNVILLYELTDSADTEIKRLKATKCGVVRKRLKKDGEIACKGEVLLYLSECNHTTVIKDMCADCGADLRQNDEGNTSMASIPMIHSVPDLKVTEKLAQKLGKADTARLLDDKKLVLLVDLDQTIIHTTNDNVPNNLKDVYHFQLYGPNSPWYHTRLRPGALQFLTNMDPYYELHICTFGARNYAHMIAQFLDEDGKFFSHRILSRDECFNATSKTDNLKALFPCGDSMVCIIDDREDVWNMAKNLIQVKPYHFFQHTGDINAPAGLTKNELDGKGIDFKELNLGREKAETKSEATKDGDKGEKSNDKSDDAEDTDHTTGKENAKSKSEEKEIKSNNTSDTEENLIEIEDPDDYLLYLEQILKKIHKKFYEVFDEKKQMPDLKTLIPHVKSEVLRDKKLVFSGLVPNNMKLEQSKAFLIAKSLGAIVTQSLEDTTTHLVAVTIGTSKVNQARKKRNIQIVTPDWLWSCAERWEHVEEKLFPLTSNKLNKTRQPPSHCHSPEHTINYTDKSETIETPKFMDTINPLLSFSNDDINAMNEDFDQFFESDTSSDEEPVDIENPPMTKSLRKRKKAEEAEDGNNIFKKKCNNDTEVINFDVIEDSMQNEEEEDDDEMPSTKFRRGEALPSDLDISSGDSAGSVEPIDEVDDGDWNMMGAALEREFLGLE